ncbi:type 1 glutamine amidotransferase [Parabacteroides sp. PF5-5]|uniref:ThuA domain-containing protein n=1 Tax=unclassified Parabacteroides TaxID=2649774 RepID=UPI00247338CF|nr:MULTISPECIES: ThuA domain-containing protein [unclassified Parabacteroides]MDH6304906.1 type 1 glutamine amidotransferase [Parabacteroides sp. PH5-39]MDH6316008.1 type 1 glutamine amidotransferase [Parabacteroides sp. PF5-13]MDH6319665.1 type 1 glutamine amidotransferase [Parabacteroides sp. PH5-13]MDH6323396.1 type 1 glutamine amidotransferase [Parabacteroides sp. PH5-8]MDH6327095.1 type 1 glutamine amidotransferase [Parabacteroides sp. PH5-41]
MKRFYIPFMLITYLLLSLGCQAKEPIKLAFISGMNPVFDTTLYAPLLDDFKDATWKAYTTEESIELFKPENNDQYDMIVFYAICLEEIPESTKQHIAKVIREGKPAFILHDGLLTYNTWPEFAKIAGMKYFMSEQDVDGVPYRVSKYKHQQDIPITVVDKNHFITQGMDEHFVLHDEIYNELWQSPDIHVLWTTTHPESTRDVMYTHSYGKGKIAGIVMGHGPEMFHDKNFKRAFQRGVLWLAQSEPVEKAPFNILVLTERGGQHGGFTDAGLKWLEEQKSILNFELTEINNTKLINEEFLSKYQVVIQLDYPPYTWTAEAEKAFINYIDKGLGGWVGFHHATLLGEFDGYPMWQWFADFMGGIRFQNYIAPLADGTMNVEDASHPVMKGVNKSFVIPDDEWYTFDKNPRPNVHVLATVDESTYQPASDIKMGDHPAVWVNPSKKARNVYFLIGHSSKLFDNKDFTTMFSNSISWTANNND